MFAFQKFIVVVPFSMHSSLFFKKKKKKITIVVLGFPGGSIGKESACSVFDSWVEMIPWRRAWKPCLIVGLLGHVVVLFPAF